MNYPLTYEEYEREVFKRFSKINSHSPEEEQENIEILNDFIENEDPHFFKVVYATSCSIHDQNIDRWNRIGVSKEQILENFLSPPLNNLEMIFCPIR